MKKRKNIFMVCVMIITLFTFLFSNAVVSAAKITIIRDPNPGGVHVLSLNDMEYSIEVDEETEIGYVVYTVNGVDEIIGTCEVIVIDAQNPSGYILCSDEVSSSCGSLTITITNELTGEGYISSVSGDLGYVFGINRNILLQ